MEEQNPIRCLFKKVSLLGAVFVLVNACGGGGGGGGESGGGNDAPTGLGAKAISAGGSHTCALLTNDTVKCWGDNSSGQLGQESAVNLGDEPNEMGDNLPEIDLG